jgi:hypothetical protein
MVCLLEERELSLQAKYPNVYFYIQPDIASAPVAGANNFSSYEMLISICHLIQKKRIRLRVGQSKVPLALKICNQVKTD